MNALPPSPRKGPDAAFIKNLFSSISSTYDRTNDVITLGLARQWRRDLVHWSGVQSGNRVLDCATGTGDLALEFKRAVGHDGEVVGSDFCADMLAIAPRKSKQHMLPVKFELGDVLSLPYESNFFDVTSIAYGIRNVSDVRKAVHEMARVTRPGGSVMILETGEVNHPLLRRAVRLYFEKIVPRLGGWVSGQPGAYQYLQSSSGSFPSGEDFCDILRSSDCFSQVEYKSLLGGASFIYKAQVQ